VYTANPGFRASRTSGLQIYEAGYIKEEVGAGGAMYLAQMYGISPEYNVDYPATDAMVLCILHKCMVYHRKSYVLRPKKFVFNFVSYNYTYNC